MTGPYCRQAQGGGEQPKRNQHAVKFTIGVVCIFVLTLSVLVLPDLRYPLLLLVLVGLFSTWREYAKWHQPSG